MNTVAKGLGKFYNEPSAPWPLLEQDAAANGVHGSGAAHTSLPPGSGRPGAPTGRGATSGHHRGRH